MAKVKDYDMEAMDELCDLGKALSSPIRLKILQLLYEESLIIGEIARKLELPASSTAFHLKILADPNRRAAGNPGKYAALHPESGSCDD